MSKAPLFPRESSQSDSRNPLPRRRSFQDLNEANKQKAKDRDDRFVHLDTSLLLLANVFCVNWPYSVFTCYHRTIVRW